MPAPAAAPIRLAAGSLPRPIREVCADDPLSFSDHLSRRNAEAPRPGPPELSRDLACIEKRAQRPGLAVDEGWLIDHSRDEREDEVASAIRGPKIGDVSPVEPLLPPEHRGPIARILLIPGAIGRFIDLFI
ncbi:MAG: hypothetical protein ACKVU4_03025 [Phycisphaerales bacterium]